MCEDLSAFESNSVHRKESITHKNTANTDRFRQQLKNVDRHLYLYKAHPTHTQINQIKSNHFLCENKR